MHAYGLRVFALAIEITSLRDTGPCGVVVEPSYLVVAATRPWLVVDGAERLEHGLFYVRYIPLYSAL